MQDSKVKPFIFDIAMILIAIITIGAFFFYQKKSDVALDQKTIQQYLDIKTANYPSTKKEDIDTIIHNKNLSDADKTKQLIERLTVPCQMNRDIYQGFQRITFHTQYYRNLKAEVMPIATQEFDNCKNLNQLFAEVGVFDFSEDESKPKTPQEQRLEQQMPILLKHIVDGNNQVFSIYKKYNKPPRTLDNTWFDKIKLHYWLFVFVLLKIIALSSEKFSNLLKLKIYYQEKNKKMLSVSYLLSFAVAYLRLLGMAIYISGGLIILVLLGCLIGLVMVWITSKKTEKPIDIVS